MTKRELIEQLANFPDNAEILVWDGSELVKTEVVASNEGESKIKAVIYLEGV